MGYFQGKKSIKECTPEIVALKLINWLSRYREVRVAMMKSGGSDRTEEELRKGPLRETCRKKNIFILESWMRLWENPNYAPPINLEADVRHGGDTYINSVIY